MFTACQPSVATSILPHLDGKCPRAVSHAHDHRRLVVLLEAGRASVQYDWSAIVRPVLTENDAVGVLEKEVEVLDARGTHAVRAVAVTRPRLPVERLRPVRRLLFSGEGLAKTMHLRRFDTPSCEPRDLGPRVASACGERRVAARPGGHELEGGLRRPGDTDVRLRHDPARARLRSRRRKDHGRLRRHTRDAAEARGASSHEERAKNGDPERPGTVHGDVGSMPRIEDERLNVAEIERAVAILRRGGLVAFPTETVYGLGARALDPAALARVFAAKGRPATHPLIAHVLGAEDAKALAANWSGASARLAEAFWPGPLTLVVPRAEHVPLELTGGGPSVGLRAPSHPIARALLSALGEPIAAPSANRYQTLSPTTAAHVAASLGERVDLILDGGPCANGIESTVVEMHPDAPRILRPGALDFPTLAAIEPRLVDIGAVELAPGAPHAAPGMDRRHYAPGATLILATTRDAALDEARKRASEGQRVGLLLVEPLAHATVPAAVRVRALGAEPRAYAHELFAALHDLDVGDVILAEPVPHGAAWCAILDRLRRGSERP
jgi:L-threonylcarbamoyladenylate synthase